MSQTSNTILADFPPSSREARVRSWPACPEIIAPAVSELVNENLTTPAREQAFEELNIRGDDDRRRYILRGKLPLVDAKL